MTRASTNRSGHQSRDASPPPAAVRPAARGVRRRRRGGGRPVGAPSTAASRGGRGGLGALGELDVLEAEVAGRVELLPVVDCLGAYDAVGDLVDGGGRVRQRKGERETDRQTDRDRRRQYK